MSKIKNFKIYGGLTLLLAGTSLMTSCPNTNINNYNATIDNNYSIIEVIERNDYKNVAIGTDKNGVTLYETYRLKTTVYKNENDEIWHVDTWVPVAAYQNETTEKTLTK